MKEENFELVLEGKYAEENAKRLAEHIKQEWGVTPKMQTYKPEMETMRSVDPVALAAIILSIPSVVLAAMDLADRLKKKKKVDELIDFVKEHKGPVTMVRPDGTIIHLHNAKPGGEVTAGILEAAEKAALPLKGEAKT